MPPPSIQISQQEQKQDERLRPGQTIALNQHTLTIERSLSQGGFAHTYLVRSSTPIRGTTQHVLKHIAILDDVMLKEVTMEVNIMRVLNGHPNIVHFIDAKSYPNSGGGHDFYILMEFCPGGGIISLVNRRPIVRLTEDEILQIFVDVLEAVAYMHNLKPPLVHRDLRVGNILKSGATSFKLCEFGSAATVSGAPASIEEARALGVDLQRHTTLQYRAPEMVDPNLRRPIDEKSDVWALGVLLYKLCYYVTPFEKHGQQAILKVKYEFPPHPSYSQNMIDLIRSMLRGHGAQRPSVFELLGFVHRIRGTAPLYPYGPFFNVVSFSIGRTSPVALLKHRAATPRIAISSPSPALNPATSFYRFVPLSNLASNVNPSMIPANINSSTRSSFTTPSATPPMATPSMNTSATRVAAAVPNRASSAAQPANRPNAPYEQTAQGTLQMIRHSSPPHMQQLPHPHRLSAGSSDKLPSRPTQTSLGRLPTRHEVNTPYHLDLIVDPHPVQHPTDSYSAVISSSRDAALHLIEISTEVVNRGGFCDIFLGRHTPSLVKLALKRPRSAEACEDVKRRIHQEAKMWSTLHHVNVLPFLGAIEVNHETYLASPWMERGDLSTFMARHLQYSDPESCAKNGLNPVPAGEEDLYSAFSEKQTIHGVASGVAYLHSVNFVHGDLKAKNVLIAEDGRPLLCDFGMSKALGGTSAVTSTRMKGIGTLRWQSPELFLNEPKTAKSDVYAFAMIIVEILTGTHPLPKLTDWAYLNLVVNQDERPPFEPTCSRRGINFLPLWNIASRCWAKDPKDRPSMGNVIEQLEAVA